MFEFPVLVCILNVFVMPNIFLPMAKLRAVRNKNLQQRAYFLRHICRYGERIFLKFGVVDFC